MDTTSYQPAVGDRVRVRRYITEGTMTPGPGSELRYDQSGTVTYTGPDGEFQVDSGETVSPWYVFLGHRERVAAYLITVVEPLTAGTTRLTPQDLAVTSRARTNLASYKAMTPAQRGKRVPEHCGAFEVNVEELLEIIDRLAGE